ncbi:radical SAM Cys-rich domain [Lecanosticta acicola]|uniref:Radical SAM Cys-rich domain n=1 Tax=Lecanosticta acicola TaxID=111012 RepID=A0AAI8Z3Q0_9PEZI|nr:radical SAM Cys-rich domain [Lecanosticta acicola]
MDLQTVERCLNLLKTSPSIDTVDITGGAPELNPYFRTLVAEARAMGKRVIDRCNLTVLFEKGQEDLADFLAERKVDVVASLPCYTQDNTDKQRGKQVFNDSVTAIKLLNDKGFGRGSEQTSLRLDLVYNPLGPSLPPHQIQLEADYRHRLWKDHQITFNSLLAITNMPIKRFADDLYQTGQYASYMGLLANAFNPSTVPALMCRNTVNVAWDGKIYDCDFNAALELNSAMSDAEGNRTRRADIWAVENLSDLQNGLIRTNKHCYGCTAGSGSSCGGNLA